MKCHTQAGNINTNLKVEVNFKIPELRATNVTTENFHVDDSAKFIYDMILEKYLLIELVLNLNSLIVSSEDMVGLLKDLQHPWLTWVNMNFK